MEVEAKLKHDLLFPGDMLKCHVIIRNTSKGETARQLSAAWIAMQIYGLLVVDPSWIILPSFNVVNTLIHKSQGVGSYLPKLEASKGRYIFSSEQILITGEITLNPGETKSVTCTCCLPDHLPPSYTGTALRYSYYVMLIGKSQIKSNLSSTRFPFTIINPEAGIIQKRLEEVSTNGYNITVSDVEAKFVSPLLERAKGGEGRRWNPNAGGVHDVSTPIKESTLRSTIETFFSKHSQILNVNINKGAHHLCKFSMSSAVYKLGDIITGHFDFSKRVLPCYQIVVSLQYTEEIQSLVLHPHRKNMQKTVHQVDSFADATYNTLTSSFIFELPLDCHPQMTTDLVDVQWSLGFEFITARLPDDRKGELHVDYAPNDVEHFDWSLPIRVLVPFYPNEVDTRCRKTQDPKSILQLQ